MKYNISVGGYQRLPKTPPCNPFSCTRTRGGRPTVNHFSHRYRPSETTANRRTKAAAATAKGTSHDHYLINPKEPNLIINDHYDEANHRRRKKQEKKKIDHGKDKECLVTRKLKELEMMDRNNVDLVLDIEEALHYYSRLTCPAYRDIVEKFFVELYSKSFNLSRGNNAVSKID
ncbi:hypothetical protein Ccrd_004044 [Cynara cardunculus var. scolymus]|uniref:Uncharacterized protein n=1 Tax=Cynara cardunculus var. scolymus TaxID=59895 RepID=A0A103XNJ4_CYNCS|nr:hypothetical protein Ccrd_004044 [Cynara cardunculus var. scolymus]